MSENLVKIYSPKDNMEADFIKNALEQANIFCFIQGYNHSSLLGGWNSAIEMSIMVSEDQADEANDIIDDFLRASQVSSSEFDEEDENGSE